MPQELTAPVAEFLELLDPAQLRGRLNAGEDRIPLFRAAIENANEELDSRFRDGDDIALLVRSRAHFIDQIMALAWEQFPWPDQKNISLVAVGGYGRGELHPHSDIDLLILTRNDRVAGYKACISNFLTLLWDINLEIGQSVRSLKQCKQEAKADITVATALMESRTLAGPPELRDEMEKLTSSKRIWPITQFLRAKWDEQIARHDKYYDVDYALEPNIKSSPGGLRDIQTIAWVAKRQFGARNFHDLVDLGFLNASEEAIFDKGQKFLWTLRYGLHLLSGRREDRLLFDKQKELATMLGYSDDDMSLAVEKLMQRYYQVVASLRELNDVLLQHLDEAILRAKEKEKLVPINKRFQIHNGYIEARNSNVFKRFPFALIEVFVLMAQNPAIQGVRASTIRLIRDNRQLVDEKFRNDIRNTSLFMELLRSDHMLTLQLRRMARYGILGRYLPEFGRITGKMQHDLFHIYTVDAHTLQVVENMRRFLLPDAEEKYPVAAHIARNLPKLELLYIAGLYHDIAKGRGGDHSVLGMDDAEAFCRRHYLSEWDTRLVCWLVQKHLLMSMTAQRKDISDPEVIHEFALAVGDKLHLNYLYALTVADICATNPNLWNAWRAALLRQLYLSTKRVLRLGLENPLNREERIRDKQQSALLKLQDRGMDETSIDRIWENAADEYFVRESVANICWHTESIHEHTGDGPLISVKDTVENPIEGGTQIFIYMPNKEYLFANSTAAFEKLNLNIQNARIFTSANGYCMDTYTVLENNGKPVGERPDRIAQIRKVLLDHIQNQKSYVPPVSRKPARQLKHFSQHVEAELINNPDKPYSTLEINCPDRPGILASVGKIFAENHINLMDARITTLGERVEDLFYITGADNRPIVDTTLAAELTTEIKERLEERFAS
ncbi:MAG: [protein-PII] uridylyltransferase [Gammaproteobacteria bacterium]|nr:[protein-PII] uridylyltransferase [Pseudomonadales bacterium]MCP5346426.1 [protein-PII] uridylyltransferase [Pseudomonadales bacterium]